MPPLTVGIAQLLDDAADNDLVYVVAALHKPCSLLASAPAPVL
jgi:hypothetical protein